MPALVFCTRYHCGALLAYLVLGITQNIQGTLLEELDGSQALQSAAPVPSSGGSQAPAEVNSADGLKSSAEAPAPSGPAQTDNAGRQIGGCNSNGPMLNLAPGAYIQFKVAVPPGFFARLEETPDGGKMITVISPEPPCPKCGLPVGRGIEPQQSSAVNAFDGVPQPTPLLVPGNPNQKIIPNYQESAQIIRGGGGVQAPSAGSPANFPQQYPSSDQGMSSMYLKNSAYRKVHVSGPNQVPYQARASQNFPPPPPPPPPSYQRMNQPSQRIPQYQQIPQGQYQQVQYSQVNSADYPQPPQQLQPQPPQTQPQPPQLQQQPPQLQQQPPQLQPQLQPQPQPSSNNIQFVQQASDSFQPQTQFNSLPQPPSPQPQHIPIPAMENFQKALRSLDAEE